MNDNGRCPLRSKRLVSVLGIRSENGSCQVVAQQPDVQERTLTTLHCHSQGQRQEESDRFPPQRAQLEVLSSWVFLNHFLPQPGLSRKVGAEPGVSDRRKKFANNPQRLGKNH